MPAAVATRRPRRLGTRTRRVVLVAHIAAAGSWLGVDVTMAVLIVVGVTTSDVQTGAACLRVLEIVTVGPLLACGLTCLVTGVVLGLGSRWGLARYWWIVAKLAINLLLTALGPLSLAGEVAVQASTAGRVLAGENVEADLTNLIYPPTVSPLLLLVAMTLSVVKPWGVIRRREPAPVERRRT